MNRNEDIVRAFAIVKFAELHVDARLSEKEVPNFLLFTEGDENHLVNYAFSSVMTDEGELAFPPYAWDAALKEFWPWLEDGEISCHEYQGTDEDGKRMLVRATYDIQTN